MNKQKSNSALKQWILDETKIEKKYAKVKK